MLQMLHSNIQHVHNGMAIVSVVAYKLSFCMQSGSDSSNIRCIATTLPYQFAIVAAFSWHGLIVVVIFVAFSGWLYGLGLRAQRTVLLYTTALASECPS